MFKILRKRLKLVAVVQLTVFAFSLFSPLASFALTSGPASPEFSSFEPVATTNLVDPFSGDFTYNLPVLNIPGPNGAGYAMSLSYHSGVTPEEEASWVGYGWTLNPGSINRQKNGYPDDYNGADVKEYSKSVPSWTLGEVGELSFEIKKDMQGKTDTFSLSQVSISAQKSVRFNNYRGFYSSFGFGLGLMGCVSLNMNVSAGKTTFGVSLSPVQLISRISKVKKEKAEKVKLSKDVKLARLKAANAARKSQSFGQNAVNRLKSFSFGSSNFFGYDMPYSVSESKAFTFSTSLSVQPSFIQNIGIQLGKSKSLNIQKTVETTTKQAYGYLHHSEFNSSKKHLADFSLERDGGMTPQDLYLAIPFSNADQFVTTGEHVLGSFRAYSSKPHHYSPAVTKSNSVILPLGFEVAPSAVDITLGGDLGLGYHRTTVSPWYDSDIPSTDKTEHPFRFSNDPAGSFAYTETSSPEVIKLGFSGMLGGKSASYSLPKINKAKDIDKQLSPISPIYTDNETLDKETLHGFSILGSSGDRSVYGQPVYSSNELNASVAIKSEAKIEDNYIVYQSLNADKEKILDSNLTVNGSYSATPYSIHHLLTEITTPDYIDVDVVGPSDNDFGGWTKFEYRKPESNYTYRMPYKGLYFQENSLSDSRENAASFTRGEKEVFYLKGIETATHYAFFITNKTTEGDFSMELLNGVDKTFLNGSDNERLDARSAPQLDGGNDSAATKDFIPNDKNTTGLEYLERIVLVSKEDPSKPLQITHFAYDYSLCPGLPNSIGTGSETGKLTLKKVWFESEGVVRARIAPYVFEYNYPQANSFGSEFKDKYTDVLSVFEGKKNENPAYQPFATDPWGNYRSGGSELSSKRFPWVNQYSSEACPAAWTLKRIILPSGGEIIVSYEQKDYAYVQDKKAEYMAQLVEADDDYNKSELTVNFPADVAVAISESKSESESNSIKAAYIAQLQEYFYSSTGPNNYLYFRMLYGLLGAAGFNSNSEFVRGHTTVKKVELIGGKIKISLGDDEKWNTKEKLGKRDGITFPREVCFDYYRNNRDGLLDDFKNDVANFDKKLAEGFKGKNIIDLIKGAAIIKNEVNYLRMPPQKSKIGSQLSVENSYVRLPVFKRKKGGGIRVNALLMYDKGLETGQPVLYGSRYRYEMEDGSSSGVAVNEPALAREENALVKLLPRENPSLVRKLFSGYEREQNEGPLGISVMSGPSIGHRRVVVENIHTGKTGTGYQVHEFHTTKDHPFIAEASEFDKNTRDRDWLTVPASLININIRKAWYSQGYSFIINNMHGKPAKVASYGGKYSTGAITGTPVSYTEYQYAPTGQSIDVLESITDDKGVLKGFKTSKKLPGAEEDIATFGRTINEDMFDLALEFDITITWGTPFSATPGFMMSLTMAHNEYGVLSSSKIWNYPSINTGTINYADGVTTVTENLVYDKYTSQPLVTRTYDGYHGVNMGSNKHNGSYISYNIPAYLVYPEMGLQSLDKANTNQIMNTAGSFVTYGDFSVVNTGGVSALLPWLMSEISTGQSVPMPRNVVNASATLFEKNWFDASSGSLNASIAEQYQPGISILPNAATIATALNRLYRPAGSYIFRGDIANRSDKTGSEVGSVYNSGYVDEMEMYPWGGATRTKDGFLPSYIGTQWVLGSEIELYSPHGQPLQERNILGINSAARYGSHKKLLPVIMGQNAAYTSLFFNDYETYTGKSSNKSHTGYKAAEHYGSSDFKLINREDNVVFCKQLSEKGAVAKLWVKLKSSDTEAQLDASNFSIGFANSTEKVLFKKIGSSEDWVLLQANFTGDQAKTAIGDPVEMFMNYSGSEADIVYIDDFSFHPADAEVSCNVYCIRSLRLLAQFSNSHFATIYIYDSEGRLSGQMVETERGRKMLREQHQNTVRLYDRPGI